ncbi:hypothetical protein HHK36_023772 [Tetracentron sinense]|uniref:Diphosphomevalonate decarboxylase-like N-terminal domain-containing protein n=1 Tax=Tetracentron sinense TaxID=13715 RepID=A0A834YNA7_TETSI|nr:hypothetical protein HHK36_023772 [Tetracentron sinense]
MNVRGIGKRYGRVDKFNWILIVIAQTPTNIVVIRYWGKRDETLILPINDSIRVTLDPDHLSTTTTVAVNPSFEQDRMWINGKYRRFPYLEVDTRAVLGNLHYWEKLHVHIASDNNFPTATGLASSVAGFASCIHWQMVCSR